MVVDNIRVERCVLKKITALTCPTPERQLIAGTVDVRVRFRRE